MSLLTRHLSQTKLKTNFRYGAQRGRKVFVKSGLYKSHLGSTMRSRLYSRMSGLNNEMGLYRYSFQHSAPKRFVRFYASSDEATTILLKMGIDSVKSGEVSKINFNVGDAVKMDDVVIIIDTDKIAYELKAPQAGVITKIHTKVGAVIEEGGIAFDLKVGAQAEPKVEKPKPSTTTSTPPKEEKKVAPTVSTEKPSKTSTTTSSPPKEEKKQEISKSEPSHPVGGERTEARQKMKKIRIRIAERLKQSQKEYAMLTTFQEIDMHEIIQMRTNLGEEFQKKHLVKLGFMSAFVKAASHALKAFPVVNSVIDGEDIVSRSYHDISVAVATPKGLVVPVLRNVENMSFADVEKNLAELANKAKDNQLAIEDMAGGTFTISNGGVYGSLMGTPIINPPQSAILGMHATNKKPYVVNDEIKIRPIMIVALTYDHRLIDGREAVLFLKTIKSCIENPNRMLLDI